MKSLKDFTAAANEYSRTEGFPKVTSINYSIDDANTAGAYMKLAISGIGKGWTRKQIIRRAYQFYIEGKLQ